MNTYSITHIHALLSSLSPARRKQLVQTIRQGGIPLRDIRPYAYPQAPGIKHVFLYFDGQSEPVPYFEADSQVWHTICEAILTSQPPSPDTQPG